MARPAAAVLAAVLDDSGTSPAAVCPIAAPTPDRMRRADRAPGRTPPGLRRAPTKDRLANLGKDRLATSPATPLGQSPGSLVDDDDNGTSPPPPVASLGSSADPSSEASLDHLMDALEETTALDDCEELKCLGRGSFGQAMLMRSKAGFSFVAKRLSLTGISYKELQRFELEVQVCAKLRHPNIVHYLATRVSKHAIQGDMLLICLEYAAGGTLAKRIDEHHERHEPFPAAQAAMWVAQVASAVSYMHSQRVMHRDLSAQNVFLSRAGDVKVGDFGLSKESGGSQHSVQGHTLCGTPIYFSPEMVNGEAYGPPSDTWAVGVLAHEILTLRHPFLGGSLAHLLRKIAACDYDATLLAAAPYSDELKAGSSNLLRVDPAARATLEELLMRPIFARALWPNKWHDGESAVAVGNS